MRTFLVIIAIILTNLAIAKNYDYCVAGLGAAGSIVCETLSRDQRDKVLCLDIGQDESEMMSDLVGFYDRIRFTLDFTGEPTALDKFPWGHHVQSQESPASLGGRSLYYMQTEIAGGGMAVNGNLFNRPSSIDLAQFNSPLWTFEATNSAWKEVTHLPGGDPAYHGTGPITYNYFGHDAITTMMQSALATVLDQPVNPDTNGETSYGVGLAGRNIDVSTGVPKRQDSYSKVLKPNLNRGNLDVVFGAKVVKIELKNNKRHLVYIKDDQMESVRCKEELVLSLGPLVTPQVLQLSGIGNCAELETLGIDCLIDNPHVGENILTGTTYTQLWGSPLPYSTLGGKDNGTIVFGYDQSPFYAGPAGGTDLYVEAAAFTSTTPGIPTVLVGSFGHRAGNVGSVKLRKNNAFIDPVLKFNTYRVDELGLLKLTDMFKKVRNMMLTLSPTLFNFEIQPSFAAVPLNATDAQIATYLAQNLAIHHKYGGATMHKVVDDRLRLLDGNGNVIPGIRIVDTSISPVYPQVYSAAGTAVLIGQRGANLILEDH